MSVSKAELKASLLEIIDTLIYIVEDDREKATLAIKKNLNRISRSYRRKFRLRGSRLRVRLKARMMVAFMCSSLTKFPKSEKLWRFLHNYRLEHNGMEYPGDFPEKHAELRKQEEACIKEINDAIVNHPIENCTDYHHLVEAFDMMRYWAHCIFTYRPYIHTLHDPDWRKVNPWRLEFWKPGGTYQEQTVLRGKSLLVDYWWDVPKDLRPKGHEVLERLASKEVKTAEDIKKLRKEVEAWWKLVVANTGVKVVPKIVSNRIPTAETLIKELSEECQKDLFHYFSVPPPNGLVMIYNNRLPLKELEYHSFTELLSHKKALTVKDKYDNIHKKSIAMSIHEAAVDFMGGLNEEAKTVLDVGCKIGHFAFLMAEAGAKVTGVEYMELPTKVARCLAEIRGLTSRCIFINTYIHKYLDSSDAKFDLTLMLNVFDHCLSNPKIGWRVLKQVSERSKAMVLMMGPTIPAPNKEDVPKVILDHSAFTHYKKLLSHSYGDRDVWGFWCG